MNTTTLDAATKTATAFKTWNELVAAMKTGYVPTLVVSNTKRLRVRDKAVIVLQDAAAEAGYRIWTGL